MRKPVKRLLPNVFSQLVNVKRVALIAKRIVFECQTE